MPTDQTRAVILQFVKHVSEKDYVAIAALGAPGATYWMAGLKEKIPLAGTELYEQRVLSLLPSVFDELENFQFDIVSLIVEGDVGALEIRGGGDGVGTKVGQAYKNDAAFRFVVKEGKITDLREYVDFFAVFKFLGVEL